jgi:FkbM family methyltransferase
VNRFSALPRAERLFRCATAGTFVERRLFGHKFVCDVSRSTRQKLIYLLGERYIAEAIVIRELIKPGMRIVDVGANIGYYMLLFAQLAGPKGSIVAVEPSPENLPELKLNVTYNNLHNVEIIAKAVGAERKRIGLLSGINSGVTKNDRASFFVEQDLIDNIATTAVDFLKIDIEGYEEYALFGAVRVISQDRPILFVEVHPGHVVQYGSSVHRVVNFLFRYYESMTVIEQSYPRQLIGKAITYYAGRGVNRIRDLQTYFERCVNGDVPHPFWIICHP